MCILQIAVAMVAVEILRTVEQNPRITPLEISKKLGISLQYIRNTLRILTELKLLETPVRGVYVLTEVGKHVLKQVLEAKPTSRKSAL